MLEFIKTVFVFLMVSAVVFGAVIWILSPENANVMMYLPK